MSKLEDSKSARVQVDALRWFAEKMSPRFANRTVSEHTGKDGAPLGPLVTVYPTVELPENGRDKS